MKYKTPISKDTAECVVRNRLHWVKTYQRNIELDLEQIAKLEVCPQEDYDIISIRADIEQTKEWIAATRRELQEFASDQDNPELAIAATAALL